MQSHLIWMEEDMEQTWKKLASKKYVCGRHNKILKKTLWRNSDVSKTVGYRFFFFIFYLSLFDLRYKICTKNIPLNTKKSSYARFKTQKNPAAYRISFRFGRVNWIRHMRILFSGRLDIFRRYSDTFARAHKTCNILHVGVFRMAATQNKKKTRTLPSYSSFIVMLLLSQFYAYHNSTI